MSAGETNVQPPARLPSSFAAAVGPPDMSLLSLVPWPGCHQPQSPLPRPFLLRVWCVSGGGNIEAGRASLEMLGLRPEGRDLLSLPCFPSFTLLVPVSQFISKHYGQKADRGGGGGQSFLRDLTALHLAGPSLRGPSIPKASEVGLPPFQRTLLLEDSPLLGGGREPGNWALLHCGAHSSGPPFLRQATISVPACGGSPPPTEELSPWPGKC